MSLLERLAREPGRAAILLDVDGTLAPIVPRPEDASVPAATRAELRRLADRYALVACISGRLAADARRVVGLDELVYVGNHGLEADPDAATWQLRMQRFLGGISWSELENKGLTASLHYRTAPDQSAAEATLEQIAESARAAGLVPRFGRKVLELLPPLDANKGTAVLQLLGEHGLRRALYAGDDTTDLDAFAAVAGLELGVRVAIAAPEGPDALRAAADLTVETPAALVELLALL